MSKTKKYTLDEISTAFFNHDSDGSEPTHSSWVKRCTKWASMKKYLTDKNRKDDSCDVPTEGNKTS
jgi:hypothetical protein